MLALAPRPASAASTDCVTDGDPTTQISLDPLIIFFDWDSEAILPPAAKVLNNAAALYAKMPRCTVVILGHTDRSGSSAYNLSLGKRRADAAAAYLRGLGVRSEIRIESHGEERPPFETVDGAKEPQNRAVVLLVTSPGR